MVRARFEIGPNEQRWTAWSGQESRCSVPAARVAAAAVKHVWSVVRPSIAIRLWLLANGNKGRWWWPASIVPGTC